MLDSRTAARPIVAGLLAVSLTLAQSPAVGEEAPSFELEAWAFLAKGEKDPSAESLKGKTILVEFWGTWCGPCVRSIPRVQALHDRYKGRGLKVLGISYEGLDVTKAFCEKNGYSFVVGSDPAKRVVNAFGVKHWPTSIVIDAEGKIAHVGTPYSVETAVEKALGLETDPGKLLTSALDALASKDKKAIESDLGRVAGKFSLEVDLAAWAGASKDAAADSRPASAYGAASAEFAKLVDAWVAKDETRKKASLAVLASTGPKDFDVVPWGKRAYGKAAPIAKGEIIDLLKSGRFDDAIEALYLRAPAAPALAAAVADKNLKEYCGKRAADVRADMKRAEMSQFIFGEKPPRNNDDFWKELGVSGVRTSEDRNRVTGILVGDGFVTPANVAFMADCYCARAFIMESLAAGKEPQLAALSTKVAKDREQLRKQLAKKYAPE
jgi:peroxiredoxin